MSETQKQTEHHYSYRDAGRFTKRKIEYLQNTKESGPGKAALARLRHAAGKRPEESPDVWGIVLSELEDFKSSFSKIDPDTRIPLLTPLEESVFHALTLYGVASQGHETHPIQTEGVSVGAALGRLIKSEPSKEDSMRTKMKSLLLSKSIDETAKRLRPMIKYLVDESGLDFAMLADDLYWSAFPKSRRQIHLKWARDFNTASYQQNEENKGE